LGGYSDEYLKYQREIFQPAKIIPDEKPEFIISVWRDNREYFNEESIRLVEEKLPNWVIQEYPFIEELPKGIAVMGGVARSIAREVLTGDKEPIRDIDLVHICDSPEDELDEEIMDELSRKYMADDYSHGHGIGEDTTDNYFKTRDFTINQVLIKDGKLIYSEFARDDFQENIIRPTYYELDSNRKLSSRLFLKSILLQTVLSEVTSSVPLLEGFAPPRYYYDIRSIDIALTLNKAMSRGAKTARLFTQKLAEWGLIPEELADRPKATAVKLLSQVYDFEFRSSDGTGSYQDPLFADLDGFFYPDSMAEFHASDPKIKAAIEEYEDEPHLNHENFRYEKPVEERQSGKYTAEDYAEINRFGR